MANLDLLFGSASSLRVIDEYESPASPALGEGDLYFAAAGDRSGFFTATLSDLTAALADDPEGANVLAAVDDLSGAAGGLVRLWAPAPSDVSYYKTDTNDWSDAIEAAIEAQAVARPGEPIAIRLPANRTLSMARECFIRYDNVTVLGDGAILTHGLVVVQAGFRIINVTVKGSPTYGFLFHRGQAGAAINCWAEDCLGAGFILGGGQHSQVGWGIWINCYAYNCKGGAWYFNGSDDGLIVEKVVENYPSAGVILSGGSGYNDGTHTVWVTGGSGTRSDPELRAIAVVKVEGGAVTEFRPQLSGRGYAATDVVGIEAFANTAPTTLGAGSGFQYRVDEITVLAASAGQHKNWCNSNKFFGLYARGCYGAGIHACGTASYNDMFALQIEGNHFETDVIVGEWAEPKWVSGHVVSGNGTEFTGQRVVRYHGAARHAVHAFVRFAGFAHSGTLDDLVGLGQASNESSRFLLCPRHNLSDTDQAFTTGLDNTTAATIRELSVPTSLRVEGTFYHKDGFSQIPPTTISKAINSAQQLGHVLMIPLSELPNGYRVILHLIVHSNRANAGGNAQHAVCHVTAVANKRTDGTDEHVRFFWDGDGLGLDEATSGYDANDDLKLVFGADHLVINLDVVGHYHTTLGEFSGSSVAAAVEGSPTADVHLQAVRELIADHETRIAALESP